MYLIVRTKDFEKSYKKVKDSGTLKRQTIKNLTEAIEMLAQGKKLPAKYKDHQLRGELEQYRECHIKGDLLLVYQIRKKELLLVLVDIGTHSYLGF
ncbi:MAG: type II toxin-antitoxin system YafQ family toxin [Minisyncoccia bacterium]